MKTFIVMNLLATLLYFTAFNTSATTPDNTINTDVLMTNTNMSDCIDSTSVALCTNVYIGDIIIHTDTGEVEIPAGMEISEASMEFWNALSKAYPELFVVKKD
jgi:hypothetical protein